MKKIITFLIIVGMIFSFNINVFAEGENTGDNNTGGESGETGGETGGESGGESGGTEGGSETGGETGGTGGDSQGETTLDDKKSDATLSDIKINDYNKVECLEKNNMFLCEFNVTDKDVDSVKVTYKKGKDGTAKSTVEPESGFTKKLDKEVTEFSIKVTSEDETKKNTYNFKITKKVLSTDSKLKRLVVNGTEIELKDDELKYKTTVSHATKKIEIEAVPSSEKAKVIDFKNNKASFDFFQDSKEFKIKVQSEAGDMVTYTVTVTKRSEADVTLKSLTIKNHELDFDSETNDYELKVLKNVDKLDIKAVPNNKNADVKITNPKLVVGENEVKIEVTNDGNTNTYTIKVTKLNEDDKTLANLKSLTIDNYEIDFKPDKYEYDLKIENENHLGIKAIAKMLDADVEITGNLDLEDGSIIKVKVTYDGEFSNVYKINISKEGGTVLKNKVSKKGVIAIMIFDIASMVIIGISQFINKIKNNKNDDSDDDSDYEEKTNLKKKSTKRNNIIDNLDDEMIDII